MAGDVSTPIFVKDAQYLSLTAEEAITLGNIVKYGATADTVGIADASAVPIGVAVEGNRVSRTQTDNEIASGAKVTVLTRGIARVYTDNSAIVVGAFVKPGNGGIAVLDSAPAVGQSLGWALDANGSAAATIRVKLIV